MGHEQTDKGDGAAQGDTSSDPERPDAEADGAHLDHRDPLTKGQVLAAGQGLERPGLAQQHQVGDNSEGEDEVDVPVADLGQAAERPAHGLEGGLHIGLELEPGVHRARGQGDADAYEEHVVHPCPSAGGDGRDKPGDHQGSCEGGHGDEGGTEHAGAREEHEDSEHSQGGPCGSAHGARGGEGIGEDRLIDRSSEPQGRAHQDTQQGAGDSELPEYEGARLLLKRGAQEGA